MDSMLSPLELPSEDNSLRLPPHCTTVTAEDVRAQLVEAFGLDQPAEVDASDVSSVGQAVLQVLLAAKGEAERVGQAFSIVRPSAAFLERVNCCRLTGALGVPLEKGDQS